MPYQAVSSGSDRGVTHPDVRRSNLGLVLRHLRDHGPRSRATLAAELRMTRSTVSTLVAELIERRLLTDGPLVQSTIGRPGTAVELDGRHVCGIGAEINVNHVSTMALDLSGRVVAERKLALDARSLDSTMVLGHLADLVRETVHELDEEDVLTVGLTVGVAGLYDQTRDVLAHGPNLGWYDVPVGSILRRELGGAWSDFPVVVDNEGNLAAAAEVIPGVADRQDMLVLHGEIGVGGGIVSGGRLLRGSHGFAGEFGHMIVEPGGRQCGCGRQGCWETVSGLRALLELAADPHDPIRNPAMALDDRLAEINRRADLGDARTLQALEDVGRWVGIGAAILVNALNPATIVLTGYYAAVGHHMRSAIERALHSGVLAPDSGGTRVELSVLGFSAAVRGGATASLESVFADPTRVPRRAPMHTAPV